MLRVLSGTDFLENQKEVQGNKSPQETSNVKKAI